MCGIFGMAGRRDHQGLKEAALTLSHRGPDGFGEWSSPGREVYLAHCRLAIIDLSEAGRQPLANEDGSVLLTFNGEIYNFAELRAELVEAGHTFASNTDSEVIVHGYEQWGDDVVLRLRGIFAFGLWDERRRRLFIARDHLGVKPLHYTLHGGELAFASETRALLPVQNGAKAANVDGVMQFLRHGYVLGSNTIWQGIDRLPPAHTLAFETDTGRMDIRRYWSIGEGIGEMSAEEAEKRLGELLRDSVGEQLVSDVPVGVFLSGGVDSSLVAAFATDALPRIDSFFVDFVGWQGSERKDAEVAAMHLGTRHHVGEIQRKHFGLEDPVRARQFFGAFDEPIGDPAILPTWHLARRIREEVTVALSGDGGDELFGGYRWYEQVRATPRRELSWQAERLRRLAGVGREWPQGCASQAEYYHLLHCPSFAASELAMLFPQWAERTKELSAGIRFDPSGRVQDTGDQRHWQALDLCTYLVDNNLARVDRASMAHGLEVRVPMLDHRIASFAMSLPASLVDAGGGGKPLLRRLFAERLPAPLHAKPKQGFSFPMRQLISEESLVQALQHGSMLRQGMMDQDGFRQWMAMPRQSNHEYKLWLLFVLENWARNWLLDDLAVAA